ncbi:MAG: DUF4231 domain-containing protein [Thermomicrobiales bacterium]
MMAREEEDGRANRPTAETPANGEGETRIGDGSERALAARIGDRYRVERALGQGAFGRVYLAVDTILGSAVAIKELLAARDGTDADRYREYAERFRREAQAARLSQHPNIVTIYDLLEDDGGNLYLVMEYVDGADLRDLLARDGALPVARALAIAADIAHALEAVHEHGVVHRDVKPANIMLTRRGIAKLTDFGIALLASEATVAAGTATHPGTPMYMSPEQERAHGSLDGRSDLYSLGLVLYEMLVGIPYGGRRRPLAEARPDLPPEVITVVEKLMRPEPEARYQSATEAAGALEGAAGATAASGEARDAVTYPALGSAASHASRTGQRNYKRSVQWDLWLLIGGGAFSVVAGFSSHLAQSLGAIVAATLLVGSIAIKATNRINRYDRAWFGGRAAAETVKKLTWLYMMRVTPYDVADTEADHLFIERLKEVAQEQDAIHLDAATLARGPVQITAQMRAVRGGDFARRKAYYSERRVRDQIGWYTAKAAESARAATFWFWATLALQAVAVAAVLIKAAIGGPNVVALVTAFAAAGTAWSQLGRHDELAKTYALTATNLSFALTKLEGLTDEAGLGALVSESEDYISREHQMWVARHN